MEKIAVIVATYGSKEWFDRGDAALAKAMASQGSTVTYFRWHSETLAGSRNSAAVHVTDRSPAVDALCFLDADDELAPGYCEAMLRAPFKAELDSLDRQMGPEPRRIYVPRVRYIVDGQPQPVQDLHDVTGHRPLLEINYAVVGSVVPRDLFLAVGGFDPQLPIYEDWDLWLRCERAGVEFIDVPDAVYEAERRPDSRNVGHPGLAGQWYEVIRNREIAARAAGESPFVADRAQAEQQG